MRKHQRIGHGKTEEYHPGQYYCQHRAPEEGPASESSFETEKIPQKSGAFLILSFVPGRTGMLFCHRWSNGSDVDVTDAVAVICSAAG